MPLSDRIEQLEGEVTTRVEEALRDLRDNLRERLRAGEEEALRRLDELTERIPKSLLRRQDVEPIARGAGDEGRREAWGDLLEGLTAIDGSEGQADALDALLAEALRYASRAVLFLTRSEGAEAWGASGWEGVEVAGTRVGWDEGDGWRRLAEGRGTVRLGGGDCGALCSRLESPLPAEGVLVPLVLRDRVAAALYADRLEGGGALGVEALQLLTWATGQAIESQPFRRRAGTPTLIPAAQGDHPLPLWDAPFEPPAGEPAEAGDGDAEEPAGAAAATAGFEEPGADDAAAAFEAELAAADFEEPRFEEPGFEEPGYEEPRFDALAGAGEPAVEEAAAGEEAAAAIEEPEPFEEPASFEPEPFAEPEPEPEPAFGEPEPFAEPEPEEPESPPAFGATQDVASYSPEIEPPPAPEWEGAAGDEEEPAEPASWGEPPAAGTEQEEPEPAAGADTGGYSEFGFEPPEPLAEAWGEPPADPGRETVEEPGGPEPAWAEPEPEPEDEEAAAPAAGAPSPTVRIDPSATVFIDRSRLGLPDQEPPPPPAEPEDEPGEVTTVGRPRGGALVTPPEDVIGPGWAFARGPASTGDDQAHEGARRLARLLVSEIRLYNEDQVEEGRRHNDIYSRLRDDIDRSRQMYEERVDPAVLGSADYFREELVRILAAGDAEALGMES